MIVAINGQSCEYITLNDAVSMLNMTNEVVYLKIKKDGNSIGIIVFVPLHQYNKITPFFGLAQMVPRQIETSDTVTYSVQLNRDNQQLGIILGNCCNVFCTMSLCLVYRSESIW